MRKKKFYTEQQLVDNFQHGNQAAFGKLFHLLYPALCFYALRFTHDQGAAEDIAEESFLKVWDKRKSFSHFKVLRSFLYSTVRNACLNWIKQKERHSTHEKLFAAHAVIVEPSILENIVRAEVFLDVYTAFGKLPHKCREIMSMVFFEGKNIREIAEELHLSVNTVKAQKRRGILLLRGKLLMTMLMLYIIK
jgi:RNA polymerase sigma-70 factor (family 1)